MAWVFGAEPTFEATCDQRESWVLGTLSVQDRQHCPDLWSGPSHFIWWVDFPLRVLVVFPVNAVLGLAGMLPLCAHVNLQLTVNLRAGPPACSQALGLSLVPISQASGEW